MPLTTDSSLSALTSFDEDVRTKLLQAAREAEREARDELGDEHYAEAASGDLRETLTEAETLLTVAIGLHATNLQIGHDGIVRATGYDASRSELMSHRELTAYAQGYRDRAERALSYVARRLDDVSDAKPAPPLYVL